METEQTLKVGDVCVDCQQLGVEKYLRYFKLNLNGDTLLKCESNECMYPYNDDIYSTSDEEEEEDNEKLVETNSLKFVDDFLEQYTKEKKEDAKDLTTNLEEPIAQFDMSFFDNLQEINNENNVGSPEFVIETLDSKDNKQNIKIIENQLSELTNPNETLKQNEFTIENFKVLDNKNDAKIMENHFSTLTYPQETLKQTEFTIRNVEVLYNKNEQLLTLDSINSTKCEITNAVVQEFSNNDTDSAPISYITYINDVPKSDKTIESTVNEQSDKQISLSIFQEDNVLKDCKPKIDIQSIETIKIETPISNILPTLTDNTTSQISTNNSPTSLKATRKYTKKSVTKIKAANKISMADLKSSKTASIEAISSDINNKSSSTSLTSDIPKANILKGSDILKKLALAEEKSSKLNSRLKASRNNKKITLKPPQELKPESSPPVSLPKNDTDFCLDKLSEILNNKLKRESKKLK